MKCLGCDTPIPAESSICPMCGAAIKRIAPVTQTLAETQSLPCLGQPREIHHHHHSVQQPIQIEQTGKRWKLMKLKAVGLMLLGLVSCSAGLSGDTPNHFWALMSLCFWIAGIITHYRARFGAWWHHG